MVNNMPGPEPADGWRNEIAMLKLQDFRDMGFKVTRTEDSSPFEADTYTWLCQKPVYDEYGKKYFINVYVSDTRLWKTKLPSYFKHRRTLVIKMAVNRGDLTFWIDISKQGEFTDIKDIEELVEEVWVSLDCDYYE